MDELIKLAVCTGAVLFLVWVLLWACGLVFAVMHVIALKIFGPPPSLRAWLATRKWTPEVGDEAIFMSIVGPVRLTITSLREDGTFWTESRTSCSKSSSLHSKDELWLLKKNKENK